MLMIKLGTCRMHVKYCEDCEDWEPIPYHNKGGVCLRRRTPTRQQLTPDLLRLAAKAHSRNAKGATRPRYDGTVHVPKQLYTHSQAYGLGSGSI
jgi:hypothetical protein